jgi:SPP1 gp7 family putative phage head morphogenesis protein
MAEIKRKTRTAVKRNTPAVSAATPEELGLILCSSSHGMKHGLHSAVTPSVSADWKTNAEKAWRYSRINGRCKDGMGYWLALALGEGTNISCDNEAVQEAAKLLLESLNIDEWLSDMMQQLLVKGDCTGFMYEDGKEISRIQCLNPISVKTEYEDGVLKKASQQSKQKNTSRDVPLDIEHFIHRRWDVPEFEDHGASMLLPAFEHLDEYDDLRKTDRVITKRYREPLVQVKMGGERAKRYIRPDRRSMDALKHQMDNLQPGESLITEDVVDIKIHGLDNVVPTSDARYERLDQAISYDLGLPRSLSSGDGPNRETANASVEKVLVMVGRIRRQARKLLDWVFGRWQELNGTDEVLSYGTISTDPWLDLDIIKIYVLAYEHRIVSRATVQEILKLNAETEQSRIDAEIPAMTVPEILSAVQINVMSADEARERLGLKKAPEKEAADAHMSAALEHDVAAIYAAAGVPLQLVEHNHQHEQLALASWKPESVYTPTMDDMSAAVKTASKRINEEIAAIKAKPSQTAGQQANLERLTALRGKLDRLQQEFNADLVGRVPGAVDQGLQSGVEAGLQSLKDGGLPDLKDARGGKWNEKVADVFASIDTGAIEVLKTQQIALMGSVSTQLMQNIHQEITAGIMEGASIDKVARRIGKYIDDPAEFVKAGGTVFQTTQQRLQVIVRTETLKAHNEGAVASFRKNGIANLRWLASDPCPICLAMNGREYELDDPERPELPYHPNCGCTWVPVIENLKGIDVDG